MRILVTGGGGYIGSVLVPRLLGEGHRVTVLDRFYFGRDMLAHVLKNRRLNLVQDDTRYFDKKILNGIDAVLDLAALSNDPSGELDPRLTMEINFKGRSRVATLARQQGVGRYVLASSCSIYGFADGILDERSPVNPLTAYARANRRAEIAAKKLAGDRFAVTMLRFATVFGLSPRMRFDLAINGMTLGFFRDGQIPIMRDGRQWRPFIHVQDVADAYLAAITAPADLINGQIFNVGSDSQNHQILPLAKEVARAIRTPFKKRWYGDPDSRSYRISFDKIRRTLGYETRRTAADGAREVYAALRAGTTTDSTRTKTVEWYRYLLEAKAVYDATSINGRIL